MQNIEIPENVIDVDWYKAVHSDEKPIYYRVYAYCGNVHIKKYKPSMAKLIAQRTGYKMEIIG